jgi:adenosylcobinamide-GDP ribazoletransferase
MDLRPWWRSLLGALLFYTIFPLPRGANPSFERIARWCPWIGIGLGGLLMMAWWGLMALNVAPPMTAALLVSLWLGLTGGLHLDGAMDSADGLAVTDPQKRLTVMADSVSGAFGVMTAVLILLLKVAAISGLSEDKIHLLFFIPAWGRWAQVVAIAFYPYLKAQGKGAFHKTAFQWADLLWGTLPMLLLLGGAYFCLSLSQWLRWLGSNICFCLGAIAVAHWFARKFQGHTGDTYGATVEWSEVMSLISLSLLTNWL